MALPPRWPVLLLLESAMTGQRLDSQFAVTGDLNTDGTVQPIGGVAAKIRGAVKGDCSIVAIPEKNSRAVYDKALMDGLKSVLEAQIFSLSHFDQAIALARLEREENVKEALREFELVQTAYRNSPSNFSRNLRHPKMIQKLVKIIELAPNHLSAEVLLAHAQNRAPSALSLDGSFSFIDKNAFQIVNVIEKGKVAETNDLDPSQVGQCHAVIAPIQTEAGQAHLEVGGSIAALWRTASYLADGSSQCGPQLQ